VGGHFTWIPADIPDHISLRNKNCREYPNTCFIFHNFIFENRAIDAKNTVESSRPQLTIRLMHTACCIPKATNTHFWNLSYLLLFCYNSCWTNALIFTLYIHYLPCLCIISLLDWFLLCMWSARLPICVHLIPLFGGCKNILSVIQF
jgi:hypothetical protein